MAKVQGEGDYESARRYNERTRKFVKKAGSGATKRATGGVDAAALRKAKSKSKGGKQDTRDEVIMRNLVSKKSKSAKSKSASRTRA
jgi:hypothetical protein